MERLGDSAKRLLAGAGVAGAAELSAVTAVWRSCVGDVIAGAAWPRRIARDGALHVATSSSTWAFELDRLSGQITERLRAALGDDAPVSLRFAPGPVPDVAEDADQPAPERLQITAGRRSEGDRLAASIEDPELRRLVARAAAASLERGGSNRGFC